MRVGWSALKVIRRPAPSSERAGTGKGGNYYNETPMRSFTVSDVPLPHDWSYYHARLQCGLVKGKHIDEVFGSKTALVWLARSGNADQLKVSRR